MPRLTENASIANAKLEEDLGNQNMCLVGSQDAFSIGTYWCLDGNLVSWSDQCLVQALRMVRKFFPPQTLPRSYLFQKGRNRLICILQQTAPEPLQCEDLKLTFSLEDVSWMQERRKSQLSQDIFKDLLSGSKIQTVLFTIHFQCSKP